MVLMKKLKVNGPMKCQIHFFKNDALVRELSSPSLLCFPLLKKEK